MTADEAREWAEKHVDGDTYEEIFGVVEDDPDDEKTVWTLRVSPATIERVRRTAGDKKMLLSEVVEAAVAMYCK